MGNPGRLRHLVKFVQKSFSRTVFYDSVICCINGCMEKTTDWSRLEAAEGMWCMTLKNQSSWWLWQVVCSIWDPIRELFKYLDSVIQLCCFLVRNWFVFWGLHILIYDCCSSYFSHWLDPVKLIVVSGGWGGWVGDCDHLNIVWSSRESSCVIAVASFLLLINEILIMIYTQRMFI